MNHNIWVDKPKCIVCGATKDAAHFKYATCSKVCGNAYRALKAKESLIEKYGVDNPLKCKAIHDKQQDTIEARYGTRNAWKIPSTVAKREEAWHEHKDEYLASARASTQAKYGVDYPLQAVEVLNKTKSTMLEKFGVEYGLCAAPVQKKIQTTNTIKYGGLSPFCSQDVRSSAHATIVDRYGVDNVMMIDSIKAKQQTTNRLNHGGDYGTNIPKDTQERILEKVGDHASIPVIAKDLNIGVMTVYRWLKVLCPDYSYAISFPQKQVEDLVRSVIPGVAIKRNDRTIIKPKELDIYVPSLRFGIEVHGAYWHTDFNVGKTYHYDKWNACVDAEVKLLQIFDYELDDRRIPILKSIIAGIAGQHQSVGARKCQVQNVTGAQARTFYNDNHWQGFCRAQYHFGLIYKGELIACASFGKSRFEKDTWEVIRYCARLNTSVSGGVSRLFHHFCQLHNPTRVVSYSDNRLFSGESMQSVGFTHCDYKSRIGYVWWKQGETLSRQKTMKHQLGELLGESFDPTKSEVLNMTDHGWFQVHDAGQTKWVWNTIAKHA